MDSRTRGLAGLALAPLVNPLGHERTLEIVKDDVQRVVDEINQGRLEGFEGYAAHRVHTPTDRYAAVPPREPTSPWRLADQRRAEQHRRDREAACRGARLLYEAQTRAGGVR